MKTFEIMWDDLTEEAQKRLCAFEGEEEGSNCNYDVMPICILEREVEV